MKTIAPAVRSGVRGGEAVRTANVTPAAVQGTTKFVVPWMSIAALDLALTTIEGKQWTPRNPFQERWVTLFDSIRGEAGKFGDEELVRIWAKTAEEINQFMAEHGFPEVELDPWEPNPPSIGVGSVLKVLMKWKKPGKRTKLDDTNVDAVQQKLVQFFTDPESEETVAKLETEDGGAFFMVMEDRPLEGFELWDRGVALAKNATIRTHEFDEVRFPMVSLDAWNPDAAQLIAMHTLDPHGTPWDLVQAKEKVRIGMNEIGVKVEGAFAAQVMMRGFTPPPEVLEINRPFVAVLMRPGVSAPVMVARICPDDWKDPGTL